MHTTQFLLLIWTCQCHVSSHPVGKTQLLPKPFGVWFYYLVKNLTDDDKSPEKFVDSMKKNEKRENTKDLNHSDYKPLETPIVLNDKVLSTNIVIDPFEDSLSEDINDNYYFPNTNSESSQM